jgi:ketopantoate reductase
MRIGVIGVGALGRGLASKLAKLGHEVLIADSRGPETLTVMAAEIGATPISVAEAARAADLIIVSIPTKAVRDLPKNLFAGVDDSVVVVDSVEDREAARAAAVLVAQHADDDVVARHAVDRVGAGVARLLGELLRLDHRLDPRRPRVVRHVQDVNARRAHPGHYQVRAIRPVAGRAAAVPAEVMQLVAHVRHRKLVDDASLLGVDHGEEVGLLDAGAPKAT